MNRPSRVGGEHGSRTCVCPWHVPVDRQTRRNHRPGRAAAGRSIGRAGPAAHFRHVRGDGAGADPHGLRPEHGDLLLRRRHADLLRVRTRPRPELPRLQLLVHRRRSLGRGDRLGRPRPQLPSGPGRHRRLRRRLRPHRLDRHGRRLQVDRVPDAAGRDRRDRHGDRPQPRGHGSQRPEDQQRHIQQPEPRHARRCLRPRDRPCGRDSRGVCAADHPAAANSHRRDHRVPVLLPARQRHEPRARCRSDQL